MNKQEVSFADVVAVYEECQSVKQTAKRLGASTYSITRILISCGIQVSEKSERVAHLRQMGLSDNEICARLHMTHKALERYCPYQHGGYVFGAKTPNALRIAKWRSQKGENAPLE